MRASAWAVAAAVALAVLGALIVRDHTREDSLSADEPIHILSGRFAVVSRSAVVNIEHPPLMKALSGLALATVPLEPPPARVPLGSPFTSYGTEFFFDNAVPPDRIIAAARAPFLAVFAGLILLVFFAARSRYGAAAGLFAAALVALDPNFVAHAGVVHTDLGAAVAFLAAVLAWERARRRPAIGNLALAAVCLGLAFTTKFSSVYLPPILLLQTLLAPRALPDAPRLSASLGRLIAVGVGSLVVVLGVYSAVTSGMNRDDQKIVIREKVGYRGRAPELAEKLVRFSDVSAPLAHYAAGLASVARQNAFGGTVTYLNGRVSAEGFPEYFFVAFGAKSTLAFLALTAAILAALVLRLGVLEEARLFLVPVAVLFLASIGTTYNIGIRHLLPVYPFLALFGAALFSRTWARRHAGPRWRLAAAAWLVLPALTAVELARIHPHELSYFNPLVGGPERGEHILSDSNIDWGLDLRRLAAELRRRGIEDATISYFGGDNVSYRLGLPDFSALPLLHGRTIAISTFLLTAGPEFYDYHGAPDLAVALRGLQNTIRTAARPSGRIGYSIQLFDLDPSPGGAP